MSKEKRQDALVEKLTVLKIIVNVFQWENSVHHNVLAMAALIIMKTSSS